MPEIQQTVRSHWGKYRADYYESENQCLSSLIVSEETILEPDIV